MYRFRKQLLALVTISFVAWGTLISTAKPSFDCGKAVKPDEITICQNSELSKNDVATTRLFNRLKRTNRPLALALAREFLSVRAQCGANFACIAKAQVQAIGAFNIAIDRPDVVQKGLEQDAKSPNPFGWQPNERLIEGKRVGVTPSGLEYSIYHDGSGSVRLPTGGIFGGWSISCKLDAMDDTRKCTLVSYDANVFVYFGATSTPQSVCVLGHDFPGRTGAIRVDKQPPIETNEEGCVSGDFATDLAKGQAVTTRLVKWPYDWSVDHTEALTGFSEALALTAFIHKNIQKLTF